MAFSTLGKFEDTLGSLSSATEHEVSSLNESYVGSPFRSFAQAQIPPVASILTDIATKEQERIASLKQAVPADAAVKKEVRPLKPIHVDFREKQKRHAEITSRFDKAAKSTAAADDKYQKLRAKNPASPETRRLMNERDIAAAKRDAIGSEVATSETALSMNTVIYKKQVFESLLTALENFARARKEQAEAQAKSAAEIGTLGASIREHLEPVPESFRVELEQLRAANY
jgi:hypothetical protein